MANLIKFRRLGPDGFPRPADYTHVYEDGTQASCFFWETAKDEADLRRKLGDDSAEVEMPPSPWWERASWVFVALLWVILLLPMAFSDLPRGPWWNGLFWLVVALFLIIEFLPITVRNAQESTRL